MRKFLKANGAHRKLEGLPLVFTLLTTVGILIGGLVEFLPMALVQGNVPVIEAVEPFTPLEVVGRDIYIREGCNNCHSQMVRPFRHEMERYGDYSKAGETVYESPHLWGSKRTGPDLARVGGKYPHLWHVRHMEDPRSTSPNSIMPPYPWLLAREAELDNVGAKVHRLSLIGMPYPEEVIENARAIAEAQAADIAEEIAAQGGPAGLESKEITALVAYLQRLGTDIQDPGEPEPNVAEATEAAAEAAAPASAAVPAAGGAAR